MMSKVTVLAVVAAVVAGGYYKLLADLGTFLILPAADECRLLPGSEAFSGSEDVDVWAGGTVIVTAGDLRSFMYGFDGARPGALYAADLWSSSPVARPLAIGGMPPGIRFQPHGLFVSRPRIYVTSHPWDHGSRVEVFEGVEDGDGRLVGVEWVRSVEHSLLAPRGFPNDVVEGASQNEIYVTRWLIFPIPDGGKRGPRTIADRVRGTAAFLAQVAGLRLTRVYRCTFEGAAPASCAPVGGGHVGANGIAVTKDRRTVYVSDPAAAALTVYARRSDGALERVDTIQLPHAVDNVNIGPAGELIMGALPRLADVLADAPEVPGALLVGVQGAPPPGADRLAVGVRRGDPRYTFRDVAVSDGALMSQVSGGILVGDHAFLGSPYARGALLCPRNVA